MDMSSKEHALSTFVSSNAQLRAALADDSDAKTLYQSRQACANCSVQGRASLSPEDVGCPFGTACYQRLMEWSAGVDGVTGDVAPTEGECERALAVQWDSLRSIIQDADLKRGVRERILTGLSEVRAKAQRIEYRMEVLACRQILNTCSQYAYSA